LNGSSVRIGTLDAPLLYVSPGQVNAQVPYELSAGVYPVTVTTADGSSKAENLTVGSTSPAVFAGAVIKHADGSPVTDANPALPGDILIIYCTGLGVVTPAVASGQTAPLNPISSALNQPKVTIGGLPTVVLNTALSPGFVGLYQIGIVTPSAMAPGQQNLVIESGGAASPAYQLATGKIWVTVESIWSRQLDNGVIASYLPGGAGTRGNSGNYILMGARADDTAHAGARLHIPADVSRTTLTVRLATISLGGAISPVGTGTLDQEGVATLSAPGSVWSIFGDTIPELEVLVWEDTNGNGSVDPGERYARSAPWRFKVINRRRYELAFNDLSDGLALGRRFGWSLASAFLFTFISGVPPEEANPNNSGTRLVTAAELYHTVGVWFSRGEPTVEGPVPNYVFLPSSSVSRAVLSSHAFGSKLAEALAGSCATEGTTYARLQVPLHFTDLDTDLGFAFGTANLDVELTANAGKVRVTGNLTDLYKWDLEGGKQKLFGEQMDAMGASLQAAYPTLSNNIYGQIYGVQIQLDDTVAAPPCQLTVTPSDGFSAEGPQGSLIAGRVLKSYVLGNVSTSSANFSVQTDQGWYTALPRSGTLQPNQTVTVSVSLTAQSNSLTKGRYEGATTFLLGSIKAVRAGVLVVSDPVPPSPVSPSGDCTRVLTPTLYEITVANSLATTALVKFGNVKLTGGGTGTFPYGFDLRSGRCEIYNVPADGTYDITFSAAGTKAQSLKFLIVGPAGGRGGGVYVDGWHVFKVNIVGGACKENTYVPGPFGISSYDSYSVCLN